MKRGDYIGNAAQGHRGGEAPSPAAAFLERSSQGGPDGAPGIRTCRRRAAGATEPLDAAVCHDPALAAQAAELSQLYAAAMQLPPAQKSQQQARQQAWQNERSACGKAADLSGCLAEKYARRNVELEVGLGRARSLPA